jgi:DNA-binding CsgD family transcriptional regulator
MAMGRSNAELIVSVAERNELERLTRRPKTQQRLAERARIALACAKGQSNIEVAEELGISRATVGKWRSRLGMMAPTPAPAKLPTKTPKIALPMLAISKYILPTETAMPSASMIARQPTINAQPVRFLCHKFLSSKTPESPITKGLHFALVDRLLRCCNKHRNDRFR